MTNEGTVQSKGVDSFGLCEDLDGGTRLNVGDSTKSNENVRTVIREALEKVLYTGAVDIGHDHRRQDLYELLSKDSSIVASDWETELGLDDEVLLD